MFDYLAMLPDLPAVPTGWKKRMTCHLNFGGGKGAASYEVSNDRGELTPIGYQYNTKQKASTGFTLPGVKPCMTWDELRRLWPIWLERARAKQRAGRRGGGAAPRLPIAQED